MGRRNARDERRERDSGRTRDARLAPRAVAPADPPLIRWGLPALVLVASFVAFAPVLRAGFVNFDDDKNFTENYDFRGLSPKHLSWMFTTYKMGHYQPLSWLTLGLDYTLWGFQGTDETHARGFHFTNMLLHALTALAFYYLARRLLALAVPSPNTQPSQNGPQPPSAAFQDRIRPFEMVSKDAPAWLLPIAAAAAALFFGVHPLRCESVCWVTERRDVLSGVFFVMSITAYLRYATTPIPIERLGWYFVSVGILAVSLFCKAWGMVMPAVLLLLDVWPLGRLAMPAALRPSEPLRAAPSAARPLARIVLDKIPFMLLSVIFMRLAYLAQAAQLDTMKSAEKYGLLQRIAQAAYGLVFYPLTTLLPINLIPIHDIPKPFNVLEPRFVAAAVALLVITLALLLLWRRFPAGLIAWVCYAAIVSPVLGLAQSGPQLVADRYSYLSCMPFALLAAGIVLALAYRKPVSRTVTLPVCGAAAVLLAALTWQQSTVWVDSDALWTHTHKVNSNSPLASLNLGIVRKNQGRFEEAIRLYEHSNSLDENSRNYTNIANCLSLMSDKKSGTERARLLDRAIENARKANEVSQRDKLPLPEFRLNYGVILLKRGRIREAAEEFRWFVRMKPDHAKGRNNLGTTLNQLGQPAEAVPQFLEAIRLDPNYANAWFNLGLAYKTLGDVNNARGAFSKMLQLRPADPEATRELKRLDGK